jgi:hypothetical protein
MPSRFWTGLIILCWLGTTAWFFYREWWPEFRAEQEPPFTIELADEVTPQSTRWIMYQGGKKIGSQTSVMVYKRNDTFELTNTMHNLELTINLFGTAFPIKIPEFMTVQRVSREGKLLSIDSNLKLGIADLESTFHFSAKVKEGNIYPVLSVQSFLMSFKDRQIPPVPLKSESVWNPMQPYSKIRVRPGQHWRMSAMDPLMDALKSQAGQGLNVPAKGNSAGASFETPEMLYAEVLNELQPLTMGGKKYMCHVIEYRNMNDITQATVARTWINVLDAKVLRQEATLGSSGLVLERDD